MKKSVGVITLILSFLLLITSFPVYAESGDIKITPDGAYEYRHYSSAGVELTKFLDEEKAVLNHDGSYTIPSEVDGKPVTVLGDGLFRYNDVPSEKVIIPNTVTCIGREAFTYDANSHFIGTDYYDEAIYSSRLEQIEIPDSVVFIDDYAFCGTTNLKEITIPDSVRDMGRYAFYMSGIKKAVIGSGLHTIRHHSFFCCGKLKKVTLPDTVWTIDNCAFSACPSLERLTVGCNTRLKKQCFGDSDLYEEDKLLVVNVDELTTNNFTRFAYANKLPCEVNFRCKNPVIYTSSGSEFTIKINGKAVTNCKSTRGKVIAVTKKGKVTVLNKGSSYITAKDSEGKKHKIYCESESAPSVKKSVTVRKGKWTKLRLKGRVRNFKTTLKSTKYAKFAVKRNSDTLYIRGVKKGKTTLKVKVNGVKTLKIKVKVK